MPSAGAANAVGGQGDDEHERWGAVHERGARSSRAWRTSPTSVGDAVHEHKGCRPPALAVMHERVERRPRARGTALSDTGTCRIRLGCCVTGPRMAGTQVACRGSRPWRAISWSADSVQRCGACCCPVSVPVIPLSATCVAGGERQVGAAVWAFGWVRRRCRGGGATCLVGAVAGFWCSGVDGRVAGAGDAAGRSL
jgi:hypothetical protein